MFIYLFICSFIHSLLAMKDILMSLKSCSHIIDEPSQHFKVVEFMSARPNKTIV